MGLDYDVRKGKTTRTHKPDGWEAPGQVGSKAKASLLQPGAPGSAERRLHVQTRGSVPDLLSGVPWRGWPLTEPDAVSSSRVTAGQSVWDESAGSRVLTSHRAESQGPK